ncbi:MAG TPA: rhomboid family intramembrane serine protease, partial [Solirubrobacteraceae bacterium]|nr:rhomboid family intramembrane serine protease [Solirubrobacteraceae bacterium]
MFPIKDNIPTDRFPVVTVALIVANVIIYFLLQDGGWGLASNDSGEWSVRDYALIPCDLADQCGAGDVPVTHIGEVQSVFTSMFMHGSLLHLGGNMLFLWIFGNNVEDSMGPLKYILFYLAGGIAADALQIVFDTDSAIPTLGASGAVAAVLGGYILLYPRARVITVVFIIIFFTVIELPALLVLGLWFAQQVLFGALDYGTAGGGDEGGVAYFAHIGGNMLFLWIFGNNVEDSMGPLKYILFYL